jgi:hypothetical protein
MPAVLELKVDFVKLSEKYSGKWVAIHPESQEVIAAGSTASAVLQAARDAGVPEPLVTRIVDDYGSYVTWLV